MNNAARLVLLATALAGCNLTYDREGLDFSPASRDAEPNDTLETALPLALGVDAPGTIAAESDLDFFVFTVAGTGAEVRIQTFDAGGAACAGDIDPQVDVYDATGFLVASDDDGGLDTCEDLVLDLAPGTYYVRVKFSDASSSFPGAFGYTLATAAVSTGTTWPTASCRFANYCQELDGSFTLSQLALYESDYCSYWGGTFSEGPCSTSASLAGYCDQGLADYGGPGTTERWYYDGASWTTGDAVDDCSWYGGTWIGGSALTLAVAPLFPVNGANWSSWVAGELGIDAFDSPCSPSAGLPCTHGGELRQVVVTGRSSCDGLSATDALGAFDWACDTTTGQARFVSTGLKPGKRLADLLDPWTPAWLENSVTVSDLSVPYGASPAATWWTNSVGHVPGDGRLKDADWVYVADGSVGPPYVFDADRVALAIPGSVAVGTVLVAGSDVVSATGRDFLWIEGDFDADGGTHGINLASARYSVVRDASVTRLPSATVNVGLYLYQSGRNRVEGFHSAGNSYGLYLDQATATQNRIDDVLVEDSYHYGVYLQYADRNQLSRITARRGPGPGVHLYGATSNTLRDVDVTGFYTGLVVQNMSAQNTLIDVAVAANQMHGVELINLVQPNRFEGLVSTHNAGNGVYLTTTRRASLVGVVVANNAGNGIALDDSQDNVIAGLTAHHDGQDGLRLATGSGANLLSNLVLVGNYRGLEFASSSGNTVRDLAFSDHTGGGLVSDAASGNYFTGDMRVGPGVTCDNGGVTSAGFYSTTCLAAASSDHAVIIEPGSMEGSFVGPVPSDAVNMSSHSSGYLWVDDLDGTWMDWTRFENPHRGWTMQSGIGALGCAGLPSLRTSTTCTAIWNGDAQLHDWSLRATDLVVREVLPYPGSGTWKTHAWSDSTVSTYLPHAVEMTGDGTGDDDGLCEAGEACLYTPNFGAYQGHDAMSGSTWIDGAEIFTYALNGR